MPRTKTVVKAALKAKKAASASKLVEKGYDIKSFDSWGGEELYKRPPKLPIGGKKSEVGLGNDETSFYLD